MNPDELRLAIMKGEVGYMDKQKLEDQELKQREDAKIKLNEVYYEIIRLIRKYSDVPEEYYPFISVWTIGTYFHKLFESYPELFINATKGSGKSRLMRLILAMAWNGKMVLDLKEAALFRTAKNHTIGLDEFEGIGSKENSTLRTMLNASYKKGVAVERMKKVKVNNQEEQVVERFDLYSPRVIANIWGMEEVLADRCITLILEKSNRSIITKLIEDFETNAEILSVKSSLNSILVYLVYELSSKKYANAWNNYVLDKHQDTLTTYNTYSTLNTLPTLDVIDLKDLELFNKIDKTNINGRNLELFFPLFIIARMINEEALEHMLCLAKNIVNEKKSDEFAESKDVALIDFVSKKEELRGGWISLHNLCTEFKLIITSDPEEVKWLSPNWIGRCLKRSKLISQKRRVAKGIEVMIDIDKAKSRINTFREDKDVTN